MILLSAGSISVHAASSDGYKLAATMTDSDGPITCMTIDPAHKLIIHGDENGRLYFRDAFSGQLFRKIKAHGSAIDHLTFNSNGRLLISSSRDGEIKIFDFKKDAIVQSLYSPDYAGLRFALFSIADGFIYFNSGKLLYKTRSDLTQRVLLIREEKDSIRDAAIAPDRGSLVYATGNYLKVLNTRTDQLRQEFQLGPSSVERICFINDSMLFTWSNDGFISFWEFQLGQLVAKPANTFRAGMPGDVVFSHDGSRMVAGNVGQWARVIDPNRKEVIQELFGHKGLVTGVAFGKNDGTLFTGSKDGTVRIWRDARYMQQLPDIQPSPILAVDSAYNPMLEPEVRITDTSSTSNTVVFENKSVSDTTVPEVSKKADNTPEQIGGRQVVQAGTITVTKKDVTIFVFDNSTIDGDTMSLYFNDEWILDHYGVTKARKPVQLSFRENQNNYLVMFANNLGKKPPNTAVIQFFDGKSERYFRLSSDLTRCSALNFIYRKE